MAIYQKHTIFPFRFWCHKILPLVYDDSLSYYELLCKVVAKLNELIEAVNVSEENVYNIVKQILDEWMEDGTLAEIINEEVFGYLEKTMKAGRVANVKQKFVNFYPFQTSANGDATVTRYGSGAYYVQGMCKTPTGFAIVRCAPDTNKNVDADISQIMKFGNNGEYVGIYAVDVHHGNGMVYYDGNLYVDSGDSVAVVDIDTMTITGYISLGGTCPAIDVENKMLYSVDSSSKILYKYNLQTGAISSIQMSADTPTIYNGSFYKDGIFYGVTYMNSLIMIDVSNGLCVGGIQIDTVDANLIKLMEIEDFDVDPQTGKIYLVSNQSQFSTEVRDVNDGRFSLRRAGFYVGELFLDGSASADYGVAKHIQYHPTDVYVSTDATESEAMNCKLELGTQAYPFRSLASASYLWTNVRQLICDGYHDSYGGDIYQPIHYENYGLISNLNYTTEYPLAFKGFDGYFNGGVISILDYGITLAYGNIASVDLNIDNARGDVIGMLYNGKAEVIIDTTNNPTKVAKMRTSRCELNGGNVIPIGVATTEKMHYTNQSGTNGESCTIYVPLVGGARGCRLGLLDRTGSKYVVYTLYGTTLYGSDGSTVTVTENDRTTGKLTFEAPFSFDRVDVF